MIYQNIIKNGIPELINKFKKLYDKNKDIKLQLKYYHPLTKISCLLNSTKKKKLPEFKYDNNNFIGYIKFFPFEKEFNKFDYFDEENIINKVSSKINLWMKKSTKGLIIDLRNYYGSVDIIIKSLHYFLGNITLYGITNEKKTSYKNPIWINYRFNKISEFPEVFYNSKTINKIPLVFLINQNTKKEGELVSFILKNRNKIYFIGNKTKGELFYQECFYLDNKKTLNLITNYYVDFNNKINFNGYIEPDIKTNNYMKKAYLKILG